MTIKTYQDTLCRQMLERELRDKYIIPLATPLGWHVYFVWNSMHSPAGYPDLTIAGHGRVFWVELKREGEEPTDIQKECHRILREAGQTVLIWYPHDWFDETILNILRGNSG